jgi:antitoxin ParD1/3/4
VIVGVGDVEVPSGVRAAAVRVAMASGEYVSSSEVVREALQDWQLRRALHQKELEELRHVWQEGIHSGPGHLADMEAIKTEARRHFEQAGASE